MPGQKRELTSPLSNTDTKRQLYDLDSSEKLPIMSETNISENTEVAESIDSIPIVSVVDSQSSILPETAQLANQLMSLMLPAIQSMISTSVAKAVASALDSAQNEIVELKQSLTLVQNENKELQTKFEKLEAAVDDAEQYSRRNCLRIVGIDEMPGENTDNLVLELAKEINAPLTLNDIDRSHRVGPSSRSNRQIIVKFASYRAREKLFSKKKDLKSSSGNAKVYINEDLTSNRNRLLQQARNLAKSKHLKMAWTRDGRIYIRDNSGLKHHVTSEFTLDSIVSDTRGMATTN